MAAVQPSAAPPRETPPELSSGHQQSDDAIRNGTRRTLRDVPSVTVTSSSTSARPHPQQTRGTGLQGTKCLYCRGPEEGGSRRRGDPGSPSRLQLQQGRGRGLRGLRPPVTTLQIPQHREEPAQPLGQGSVCGRGEGQ